MMNLKLIEKKAAQIVKEFNGNTIPVDVKLIAKEIGLEIKAQDLGDNVSGVLFIDKGKGVIGYNPSESPVRRRFTIAHEVGHYVLHRLNKELFVDHKQFKAVFRDSESSTGEFAQEREANAFAAALLMPRDLLIKEIENTPFDLGGDDLISGLAKIFRVSTQAMAYRMANLNLF
jgi:Zn-dependent peptidase ImmA (M78 family)